MGAIDRLRAWAAALAIATTPAFAAPTGEEVIDTSAANLIVVLRESLGENHPDTTLRPYGRVVAELPDGKRVELATSWYHYIGDMHIRLVFDGGQTLQSASPNDLERLRLSPEEALDTAVRNLRRVYGQPTATPWSGGLMQVQGMAPDFASSYFLDREFWLGVQRGHPEGVVAAVPQRGGLVFASAKDDDAIDALRFSAAALYAGGGGRRVSSGLYLFKDGRWSVFQPPRGQ
ncbi:hypothetical protein [Ramlibacter sp. PS4R-6]|uniref:hypothetical protein n=1 Tax=Ramlibacter sp. PS4R-6 TaxID=3133438 RepID=UPI003096504A